MINASGDARLSADEAISLEGDDPLVEMTALPAVEFGGTSLGMTAASAHDRGPFVERKKSQ
jgi:hypothetical protein